MARRSSEVSRLRPHHGIAPDHPEQLLFTNLLTKPSSLHAPMPLSTSGVMLGLRTRSRPAPNQRPPANSFDCTGRPRTIGEWQLTQLAKFARYSPYRSGSERSGALLTPAGLGQLLT